MPAKTKRKGKRARTPSKARRSLPPPEPTRPVGRPPKDNKPGRNVLVFDDTLTKIKQVQLYMSAQEGRKLTIPETIEYCVDLTIDSDDALNS